MTNANKYYIIKYFQKNGGIHLKTENFKTISENRKARHEYFVLESMETGIELMGTEVKSLRLGQVNLKDSWCSIDNGLSFLLKECIYLLMKKGTFLTVIL